MAMKRYARVAVAICMGFIGQASAVAADLPRSDPDRAAILDAARPAADVKFVVKELRKFGDFAFLCALEQTTGGGIIGTDDELDVYQWVFVRHAGRWHAIEAGGGFARNAQHVSCENHRGNADGSPQKIDSEQDIASLAVNVVEQEIRSALDYHQMVDVNASVLKALQSKNLLRDMSIEHEKNPYDAGQLQIAKEHCASRGCAGDTVKAFQLLAKARNDDTVSSLVWANCQYGLRAHNLMFIQRCVDVASRLPYCRPRMKLNTDRKDIGHCIADIRALCEKDLPGLCN